MYPRLPADIEAAILVNQPDAAARSLATLRRVPMAIARRDVERWKVGWLILQSARERSHGKADMRRPRRKARAATTRRQ
jgi:hypothetical protein